MKQNFRVPVNSLVELVVRTRCILQREIVRYDKGRFRDACNDEVAEIPVVGLRHMRQQVTAGVSCARTLTLH